MVVVVGLVGLEGVEEEKEERRVVDDGYDLNDILDIFIYIYI